jgi:hypothetical protein
MRAQSLRPLAILAGSAAFTLAAVLHGAGCQQSATSVAVRSLERSGRASFVCLGKPGPAGTVEHPLGDCSAQLFTDINEYLYEDDAGDVDAGSGALPHLYALVTQTTRGEVAVIDTSSTQRQVLDENPVEPGANFLPIGAQPTGIVSTPGSIATFVGVAEIGRAGIFALPSSMIRPATTAGIGGGGGAGGAAAEGFNPVVPQLSSWPACALPSAPGDIILVSDPPDDQGLERPTCDDTYGPVSPNDLISSVENQGRQKLVVSIPAMGGIAIIDAQTLLNQAPGSFDACPVERWLPLQIDLSGHTPPAPPQAPPGAACVYPRQLPSDTPTPYTSKPAGLTYADGKLYVADQGAPVIHVIDMPTPCDPIEQLPLVPWSVDDPLRAVVTERVSVSPAPTPDYKRYLFATDYNDGSIMVFDVGPNATTRRPLVRKNAQLNPFMPADRVKYASPAADILVVQRDAPETNPVTGIAVAGVRCSPDPSLLICTATSSSCDIATAYRTDTDTYQTGANPAKLRGTFAFAALKNGRLGIIDVDDFDSACRAPSVQSTIEGCAANNGAQQKTSLEQSCNVVEPTSPRAANFELVNDAIGSHVPALANYPLLYDANGGLIDYNSGPKMVVPTAGAGDLPDEVDPTTGQPFKAGFYVYVANTKVDLSKAQTGTQPQHLLQMKFEEPRAHVIDQNWAVVFEGALPGFDQRLGDVRATASPPGLYDTTSRFCDSGVLSENAVKEIYGKTYPSKTPAEWARLADYVQITRELPDELDPYWDNLATQAPSCKVTFSTCQQIFGTFEAPTPARDLRIVEAYQDHVELKMRPVAPSACGTSTCNAGEVCVTDAQGKQSCAAQDIDTVDLDTVKCCFPDAMNFTVRGGDQWIVLGDQIGFLHHVVADPVTGVCRNSCEAATMLKNGRIIEAKDADSGVFENPMFKFAVVSGAQRTSGPTDRDKIFRFTTQGSFIPLLVTLSSDPTVLVQPQGLAFVPPTGEVAITDGNSNGLIFVSLSSSQLSRSFY